MRWSTGSMIFCASSGSRFSISFIESRMSAKRTVTCFRSPSRDCREGLPRGQYLFSEVFRDVAVWRRNSGNSSRCGRCGLIDQLTANSAKCGVKTVRFITMRTNRFKPHPAAVAKDRIRQILALTLRANHNGNQSELGCIVSNSNKAEVRCALRRERPVYSTRLGRKQAKTLITILMLDSLQTSIGQYQPTQIIHPRQHRKVF